MLLLEYSAICTRSSWCCLLFAYQTLHWYHLGLACIAACRLAAEEAAKAAAAEAKKQREADKKLLKRERQRLRQLAEAATSPSGQRLVDEDSVEKLCQTLVYSQLQELADAAAAAAGGDAAAVAAVLQGALQQIQRREEEAAAAKERQKKEAEAALKVGRGSWEWIPTSNTCDTGSDVMVWHAMHVSGALCRRRSWAQV